MAGPWEKYAQPAAPQEGPWAKYAAPKETAPPAAPPANPSLFRMDSDFPRRANVGQLDIAVAAAKDMFGSRQGAAEFLAEKANENRGLSSLIAGGAKVVDGGEEGPLIELGDGTRYRLNDPGIDNADVGNVAGNVAAFFTPASWINRVSKARNFTLGGRALAQAGGMGGLDVATQVAFDRGRIDPARAVVATVGGGLGEVIAPVISRVASSVSSAVRGGSKAKEAEAVLREVGINNPTPMQAQEAREVIEQEAAGGNPAAVLGSKEFGFRYTEGQRMLDPERRYNQLGVEETLREQPGANGPFILAEKANANALARAVSGITERLGAQPGDTPGELSGIVAGRVQQQAAGLKAQVGKAYDAAAQSNKTAIARPAVETLPGRLKASVSEFDLALTPATKQTIDRISSTVGNMPKEISGVTLRAVETQRKLINNAISAASSNPADRAAMTALKREFDSWVDDAVDDALLSGDPKALDAIKQARGLRAEFGRRFGGDAQADNYIRSLVEGEKTPEELLNVALGAGQVSKDAGGRFVQRLRLAVNDDPQTLGALRAAQFLRMVQGNTGEQLGPQAIVNNIARMEYGNRSMIDALYSPEQWKEIKRLAAALEPMVPPKGIARTSGSIERFIRYLSSAGSNLPIVKGMIQGMTETKNAIKVERLFTAPIKPPLPASALPAAFGAGSASAYDPGGQRRGAR